MTRDPVPRRPACLGSDTRTTEIYTLSLHDALPIFKDAAWMAVALMVVFAPACHLLPGPRVAGEREQDRKSTRLNSSHTVIPYAVFCLTKHDGTVRNPRLRAGTQQRHVLAQWLHWRL